MPTLRIVTVASVPQENNADRREGKGKQVEWCVKPGTDRLEVRFLKGPEAKKADRAIRSRRRTQDFDFRSRKIVLCDLKIRLGGVDFLDIDTNMGARDDSGSHQTAGVREVEIDLRMREVFGHYRFAKFANIEPPLLCRPLEMEREHAAQQRMRCNEIDPVMIETEAARALAFFGVKNPEPAGTVIRADIFGRHPPNECVTGDAWPGFRICLSGRAFQSPKKTPVAWEVGFDRRACR